MNPIVLSLEGLLAVLLAATLFFGIKLERKLKALRNSQAGFATAVRDLDAAAARTEAGLDALRFATENARDLLVQRMESAQTMALRLEAITSEADTAAMRARSAAESAETSVERVANAAAASAAAAAVTAAAEARASSEVRASAEARAAAEIRAYVDIRASAEARAAADTRGGEASDRLEIPPYPGRAPAPAAPRLLQELRSAVSLAPVRPRVLAPEPELQPELAPTGSSRLREAANLLRGNRR